MFEPTIKYRRVNDPPKDISQSLNELSLATENKASLSTQAPKATIEVSKSVETTAKVEKPLETKVESSLETKTESLLEKKDTETIEDKAKQVVPEYTFEEEEDDCKIEVDPKDKERIIVTLSTGKQFSADRYCPHAGADLSYHGKVSEDDYPPEIGPVLMCPIHYWEFALEKGGKGGSGWATINACPIEVSENCKDKKLDW